MYSFEAIALANHTPVPNSDDGRPY